MSASSTADTGKRFLKPGDVDREKNCPLLLKVFTRVGGHNRVEDYERGREPPGEVQIYTWKDATLRELAEVVREIQPAARNRNARLAFSFVYPDKMGRMVMREVGQCWSNMNREDKDDLKTLDELHFETGDYLDVAVLL